jgi:hypothetical protein
LLEPPLPNVLLAFGARAAVALDSRVALRTIELAPLSQHDTATLVDMVVRELGGHLDPAAVAREAGGHPLFAAELARHAVATGEVRSITFEAALLGMTDRLGPEAKRVATLVSLAHTPIPIDAAARAVGDQTSTLFDTIATLRAAQIIAATGVGPATRLEPYHDRIRAVLTAQLPPAARQALHTRIAESLEATGSDDHAALAQHWQDAGNSPAAARHALHAAEQADAALAFHRAARLYTWVVELDPTLPNVRVRHAESLAQAGLGVAAAEAFLACAKERDGVDAIDLRRRAMQQLLLMGHNDRALELLDALMRWLELPNPKQPRRIILALLGKRARIRLRRPKLRPSSAQPEPLERARLDLLWDAAAGLAFLDPVRAFYFHSFNLERCFRSGDNARLGRALISEAPYIAASGKRTRRLAAVLELSQQPALRTVFPPVTSLAHGIIAFFFGRWRECREQLASCERLLEQGRPRLVEQAFGPQQVLDVTRRLQLAAMLYLGELRPLRDRARTLLNDALERHDLTSATHLRAGVQSMMYLAFGDVEGAVYNAEQGFAPWRNSAFGIPHFMAMQSRTAIDLYRGSAADAHRRIVAGWSQFVEARLFRAQYVHVTLLDARGRAALAANDLADANRCADALHAAGAVWSVPLAESLRGGIAIAEQSDAAAREHLERAATGFAAAGMKLYAANARMVRAHRAGDSETAAAQRQLLVDAGIVEIERYSRLLLPRG